MATKLLSNNPSPSLLFVEQGSTPSTPAAGHQRLYATSSDGLWRAVDDAGAVTVINPVLLAEVSISNAEIKALRATPKSLVAAPGAGKVLEFVGAVLIHDYGTNVLTEAGDNLGIKYTNGSGAQVSTDIEATGFVDASADKIINVIPQKDVILVANAALVLHNIGTGEFGGNAANDTVWRAKVAYRVWSTGL